VLYGDASYYGEESTGLPRQGKVKLASVKQDSSAKLPMRRVGYVWKNDD